MEVGEVRPAEEADFDRLLELTKQEPMENGWEVAKRKGTIQVYTKDNGVSSFKMIRLHAEFRDVPASTVYNTLHDSEYRKRWDKNMVKSHEICVIDPQNDIGYYQVKAPGPMKNREFVTQRSWCQRGPVYMIMNHSVFHKNQPPTKNVIRGISYYTGYAVEETTSKTCKLSYVTQSDPGGNLPSWLTNKLVTIVAPKVAQNIHKASKGYDAWKKKQNNPDFMPWLWPDQITAEPIDWDDVTNTGQEEISNCSEELDGLQDGEMLGLKEDEDDD